MPKLYIYRGLPGSGKSTKAKSHGVAHFEADMFHMRDGVYTWSVDNVRASHAWCKEMVEQCMRKGMDVAVSNTFTTLKEFKDYLNIAEWFRYKVIVTRCTGQYGNCHSVPMETLEKMKNRFQDYEGEIVV